MRAIDFIHQHTLRHLKRMGYNEHQATRAADHVLVGYNRNQFDVAIFLKEAETFADKQFGKPKKERV